MNKHLIHLIVLAAFVGVGKGLGGGAGGRNSGTGSLGEDHGKDTGAGSVGGGSNRGAGGPTVDPSRSASLGTDSHTSPKNASSGSGSPNGESVGQAGGSSSGSEGRGGHALSGGSGSAGGVGTARGSNGDSGSRGSTRSPSSRSSGPRFDRAGGFGAGHSGAALPGAASDFSLFGGGSMLDNLNSGPSSGGSPAAAGGSAAGASGLAGDQLSGRDSGFESDFGQSWGLNGRPGSSFITRSSFAGGPGFEEGSPRELGSWSSRGNSYGGTGAPGGGTYGFGGFNGDSGFGSFPSGESPYGIPEGAGGGLGTNGRDSVGGSGAFSGPFAEPEHGDFLDSEDGPGSSFPSTSGVVGSSTGESHTDIGSSNPDASNHPSSSFAHVLRGFRHQGLFSGLWESGNTGRVPFGLGQRRRKTDPRVAAAVALGTVAGLAAIGSLGAGLAAALHSRRSSRVPDIGGARRGCASGNCRRNKRSILESKVPSHILNRVSLDFERLY